MGVSRTKSASVVQQELLDLYFCRTQIDLAIHALEQVRNIRQGRRQREKLDHIGPRAPRQHSNPQRRS